MSCNLFFCCRRSKPIQLEAEEPLISAEFLLNPLEKKLVELVQDQFENSLSQGMHAFAIFQIHAELQEKFNASVAKVFTARQIDFLLNVLKFK